MPTPDQILTWAPYLVAAAVLVEFARGCWRKY